MGAENVNPAGRRARDRARMTFARLVLRGAALAAGTVGILALFDELRRSGAAVLFTALFVVFLAMDALVYVRTRRGS
jgi:hypothetical protein